MTKYKSGEVIVSGVLVDSNAPVTEQVKCPATGKKCSRITIYDPHGEATVDVDCPVGMCQASVKEETGDRMIDETIGFKIKINCSWEEIRPSFLE